MRRKAKLKTVSELLAELAANPTFVAQQGERERQRLETERLLRQQEQPLLDALSKVGISVNSAWDLVNTSQPYPEALPILIEHLQRPYPDVVREGMARALAVPRAIFAWDVLTRLYRTEPHSQTKDGLAAAIAVVATDNVINDVIALARERHHGPSRLLLLSALDRSADRRARQTLMELGTDPELSKEIQVILNRKNRTPPHGKKH